MWEGKDNAGLEFRVEGGEKRKTDMLRALEPTMKAEARTRRALEKCIFERENCLIWNDTDCLDDLESWR